MDTSAPYPVSVQYITNWIARKVKLATVKAYNSALRSIHHRSHDKTDSFEDTRVDLIIRGAKRVCGEGERRIRLPLTSDIL
jgi:hypothetical protein